MLASRAPPVSIPIDLLPECISLDIPCIQPCRFHRKPLAITRSSRPHGKDKIGGTVPRPHRSFDSCRQSRISPVTVEKQISPARGRTPPPRVFFRRGHVCRAALAPNLPRRLFVVH